MTCWNEFAAVFSSWYQNSVRMDEGYLDLHMCFHFYGSSDLWLRLRLDKATTKPKDNQGNVHPAQLQHLYTHLRVQLDDTMKVNTTVNVRLLKWRPSLSPYVAPPLLSLGSGKGGATTSV